MHLKTVFFCSLSFVLFYSCKETTVKDPQSLPAASIQDTPALTEADYLAMGKNIATATQAVLAQNLVGAISKGGTDYALEFCNLKAILLTDSMSSTLNSSVKRVSDKPRNPRNLANDMELAHIQSLKDQMSKGETPAGKVHINDSKMIGLYPIVTNAMCLQCHGKKDMDIKRATLQKIHKLYPDDKATGYGVNELRGLWVVEMNKK